MRSAPAVSGNHKEKAMKVRAKFFVKQKNYHHNGQPDTPQAGEVIMAPVYQGLDGNPANADWSKWTPQGEIRMTITNPSALDAFELGSSYLVEFTPA
jgi:hypothetical protein